MRIGELCALRWQNIDMEERVIKVRHTIQRIYITDEGDKKYTKLILDTPKTKESIRDITLSSDLVKIFIPIIKVVNKEYYILTNEKNPVSYKRAKEELAKAISNIKPDFVLCLGQAGKERKIRIEMLGINYTRGSIPDNDGVLFDRGFVKEGGPLALRCNLNIEDIVAKLNKIIPCYLSLSAGAYICNTTYYTALDLMKGNALFIHLPYYDGQVLNEPSMDIDKMVQGVKLVIDDILNK